MFLLRSEQLTQMEELRTVEYVRELRQFFETAAPQWIDHFDGSERDHFISEAVRKARSWGLQTGAGIAQFVGIALAAGERFDEDEIVHRFLAMPGSTPDRKLQRLTELVAKNLSLRS